MDGPDHGPAEDGDLPGPGLVEEVQVLGEAEVAGDVGEAGEGGGGDEGRADGEAVEAVGEVHRVAREGEQEHREDHVEDPEVGHDLLEEGEDDPGRVLLRLDLGEEVHGEAHREAHRELAEELPARGEAQAPLLHDLEVVVGEADRPEGERREHEDPDRCGS